MLSQNSNQEGDIDSNISQFYIDKLLNLEKRVQIIIHELKMPLNHIFPSDFEEKYEEAKSCEQIDSYWIQNYKEIVAFIIEGQINTPLMRLSEKFRHQFGGQTMFWMDLICSFAQNQKYDDNFRIWQVNDVYKHCLHLQKGEYEKNRKFRRLAKIDIQVSKKLISSIHELKNALQNQTYQKENIQMILNKVEANYQQHEDSNKKIVEFLRSDQQKNLNLDFFQPSQSIFRQKKSRSTSYSSSRTKKTHKQKERENNLLKQRMITDFSVHFREDRNAVLLKKIVGKKDEFGMITQEKKNEIDKYFNNLSSNHQHVKQLRSQLTQTKTKFQRPEPFYSNIFISYSFCSYNDYFVPTQRCYEFDLSKPFQQYPEVNYHNNEYEQYEQIQAQELEMGSHESDDETEDESLDTQEKRQMLQQDDLQQMDTEDREVFAKAIRKDNLFFRKAWVLNYKNQQPFQIVKDNQKKQGIVTPEMIEQFLNESTAICFLPLPMPLQQPKETQLDDDQIKKLKQIVHLKSYHQIFSIIEESQSLSNQFSKQKVHSFLGKMTKKISRKVNGRRANLYFVLDKQTEQLKIQPNNAKDKYNEFLEMKSQIQPDTSMNQPNLQQQSNSLKVETIFSQKLQGPDSKFSKKSPSISETFSNNKSFIGQNRGKVDFEASQSQSEVSETLSMRLRSRSSKPVYNLNNLLGIKSRKKVDEDVQI